MGRTIQMGQAADTLQPGMLFGYAGYILKLTQVGTGPVAWNSPSLMSVSKIEGGTTYYGPRFLIPDGSQFLDTQYGIFFEVVDKHIIMGGAAGTQVQPAPTQTIYTQPPPPPAAPTSTPVPAIIAPPPVPAPVVTAVVSPEAAPSAAVSVSPAPVILPGGVVAAPPPAAAAPPAADQAAGVPVWLWIVGGGIVLWALSQRR